MRRGIGVLVIGVVLLGGAVTASAASPWAKESTYTAQVGGKLRYGLTNTLLGWTSLFREPMEASQAGENVFGGIARGIWNAAGQTVGGAAHTVTFFIPAIDVPLPEGGTDLLQ